MADETVSLYPNEEGQFEILQLTLQEESYCQLRAQGETKRSAWKIAFGIEKVNEATLDTRVNRLEKRPEITGRINEIKREINEANAAKWAKRREELLELLYTGAKRVAYDPDQGGLGASVKAIGMISNILGWNEPQKLEVSADVGGKVPATVVEGKLAKLLELTNKEEAKT